MEARSILCNANTTGQRFPLGCGGLWQGSSRKFGEKDACAGCRRKYSRIGNANRRRTPVYESGGFAQELTRDRLLVCSPCGGKVAVGLRPRRQSAICSG